MRITDLIKNIIYLILLFGITAFLMFIKIYDENAAGTFSFLVFMCAVALLSGFSLIALRKKNIFYAASALVCLILWIYPLYIRIQDILPTWTALHSYIFILAAADLPCAANCLYTFLYRIIIERKRKKAGRRTLAAQKTLSAVSIVITSVAAVLIIFFCVKLDIQIPKDIEERRESYSNAVNLADEIAGEYQGSDLIIEEILNNHQLTYDSSQENFYIIEEDNYITINISQASESTGNGENTVYVSSDSIGIGIPGLFAKTFYNGKTQTITLTEKTE